ncbi:MAG: tetratricopeptide repeat protein [Planctomycetota bacterium]
MRPTPQQQKPTPAAAALRRAHELFQKGRTAEAIAAVERLATRDPSNSGVHQLLALARLRLGELDRARYHAERAVTIDPKGAGSHLSLTQVMLSANEPALAERHARKATELAPTIADAWEFLAIALRDLARRGESDAALARALTLQPDRASAVVRRAVHRLEMGRVHEATDGLREAVSRFPKSDEAKQKLAYALLHDDRATANEIGRAHASWGATLEARHAKNGPVHAASLNRDRDRRLTVAYLSPELREHSVGSFALPLFEHHDRSNVRVLGYMTNPKADAITERFRSAADGWRDLTDVSDDVLMRTAAEDDVDILIELSGHFVRNRLRACARGIAPVQVTAIGYPATTGLSRIDTRLVDGLTDPAGSNDHDIATERLVRIDGCFLCYAGPFTDVAIDAEVPAVRTGNFTFGSFNALKKVSPAALDLWARALAASPGSTLRLKGRGYDDDSAVERLLDQLEARGVDRDRVRTSGRTQSTAEHLAAYADVDLALDTFPYNGTTTTCEAAWMGVPTLTLSGAHHAARVGHSLNAAIGLDTFVTSDAESFVARAAELASEISELRALRPTLRDRMRTSRLMDGRAHASAVEAAYRSAWHAYLDRPTARGN